jgi:hypothetical protein
MMQGMATTADPEPAGNAPSRTIQFFTRGVRAVFIFRVVPVGVLGTAWCPDSPLR